MARWAAKNYQEIMAFFGIAQEATIRRWKKQGMPGRPGSYDLSAIAQWLRASGPWRVRKAAAPTADDGDPLLATPNDSPELERYRAARADLAEMERDERRGKLIGAERMREICYTVGDVVKSLRRRLVKQFGPKAGQLVDGGLRDLRDIADRECGPDTS